jgi:hypothetical protein
MALADCCKPEFVGLKQRHPEPHRHGEVFLFLKVDWRADCSTKRIVAASQWMQNRNLNERLRLGKESRMAEVEIVELEFLEYAPRRSSLHDSVSKQPSPPLQMGIPAQAL